MDKQPHLSDLFSVGKDITVQATNRDGELIEIPLWIKRPDPSEHDECVKKARLYKARRQNELKAEGSEEAAALEQEIMALTKQELIDAHLETQRRTLDERAVRDVAFSEEIKDNAGEGTGKTQYGSYWGPEATQWIDILNAVGKRLEEIDAYNKEMIDGDMVEQTIDIDTDEELLALNKRQEEFEAEVSKRRQDLTEDMKQEIKAKPIDRLRKDLLNHRINLEIESVWYMHFKYWQLFYAVRYDDNHKKRYFESYEQVRILPKVIQDQLFNALDEVDLDVSDLKNSLTPLPS